MTQGVKPHNPPGEASPAHAVTSDEGRPIPVLIAAKAEVFSALKPLLAASGFDAVRGHEPGETVLALQTEPDTLLLAEAGAFGPELHHTFEELAQHCPRVRRVLLVEAGDLGKVSPTINAGLVHRLLLRPIGDDQVVEALRAQARHQNLANRTSELKALAAKKSHELDLAQRLLRLQRLAAVGTLAAGLAHEINNPLGSILAFAQILIREGKFTGEDLEALQFIEQGAVRCKRVIDAVVRFAHMANAPETDEPVRLAEVAEETAGLMKKELEGAGIETRLQIADPGLAVRGSLQSLLQLVQALVANAGEAIRSAERRGKIAISVFVRDNRACISVSDNGRGIAPELRDRIFEPFYTTKTEGEAIGLGLTTADRIAHLHGGLIEVESEPDRGSTFTVVLPGLDLGVREGNHND